MWPPTIYQLKRPSVNDNEIVAKQQYDLSVSQAKSSESDLNSNTPAQNNWNIKSLFSLLNSDKSLASQSTTPSPISKLDEYGNSDPSNSSSPPRKYNPLCFFSALPCSSRRKDIYYIPRRESEVERQSF
uniref:Uncharacterized protein n=1 Tax=Acrobeloides nanus TaxID=290746 RepID=A0A914CEB2_9BILA